MELSKMEPQENLTMDFSKVNIKTEKFEIDDQLSLKIENSYQTDLNLDFNIKNEFFSDVKKEPVDNLLLEGTSFHSEDNSNGENSDSSDAGHAVEKKVVIERQSEKAETGIVCNSIKKTNAQKQKEYRERKKLKQAQNSNSANGSQGKRSVKKTPSQYMKEYRARKLSQDRRLSSSSKESSTFKEKEAQRLKEYRERKKMSEDFSTFKEREAKRLKEYRERRKLSGKCQSPNSSQETRHKNAQKKKDYRNRMEVKNLMLLNNENEPPSKKVKPSDVEKFFTIHNSQIAGPSRLDVPCIDNTNNRPINENTERYLDDIKNEEYIDNINENIDDQISVNENEIKAKISVLENFISNKKYNDYNLHARAHMDFINNFKKISFGHPCAICDRLWWKNDLKKTNQKHENILKEILKNYVVGTAVEICSTCKTALDKDKIPLLSTYNGFSYPNIPSHLLELDLVSQRLICPRIPFMQIRRLRHVHGQYGIYGQVINVPVSVNTMVHQLPRNIDDDHCFYVHIKKKIDS